MLSVTMSESPSRGISVTDETGKKDEILRISCTMRPGSGLYISVDITNAKSVAANLDDVQAEMTAFLRETLTRAADMGLPVPSMGGDAANAT